MADPARVLCGLAVVHPSACDTMGHMTTHRYLALFDDAAYHLLAALGEQAIVDGVGWADVKHELEYRSELRAGDAVRIEGRITALGNTSFSSEFLMFRVGETEPAAICRARTVHFDLKARRALPLPQRLRDSALSTFALH